MDRSARTPARSLQDPARPIGQPVLAFSKPSPMMRGQYEEHSNSLRWLLAGVPLRTVPQRGALSLVDHFADLPPVATMKLHTNQSGERRPECFFQTPSAEERD